MITRGIKYRIDQFITELQGKYLSFKYKGEDAFVQVAVRPIQLWEVVFPKEHLDVMMTTLFGSDPNWMGGRTQHKKHQKYVNWLRKLLGISSPPTKYDTSMSLPLTRKDMESVCVGIKEDYETEDGEGL